MIGDNDPMEQEDEEFTSEVDMTGDEDESGDDDDFIVPDDETEDFVVPEETAKQRKAARGREYNDRRREDAERERDDLRRELDEMRRRPAQQAPAQPQRDIHADRVQAAHDARTAVYEGHATEQQALGNTAMSAERQKEWLKKSQAADDVLADARANRRDAQRASQNSGEEARRQLAARHPDITSNPTAMAVARGLYAKATAGRHEHGDGKPDNHETMDEVMDQVRETLHMGRHRHGGQAPTDADRRKHQGVPRGRGAPPPAKRGYKMTELDRKMADIALDTIEDPKERYRVYAKGLENDT